MRPDAIPVTPLATYATLAPEAVQTLFGTDSLRGTESVEIVRHGTVVATAPVSASGDTALAADQLLDLPDARGLRLVGPKGSVGVARVRPVRSTLIAPAPLARAWGLGSDGTVTLGRVAVSVPFESGEALALRIEAALWHAAGRPETARWAAGLVLPVSAPEASGARDSGPRDLPKRVITETDVRQAMLRHTQIRLRPDQIVTPAARSLGADHEVFVA